MNRPRNRQQRPPRNNDGRPPRTTTQSGNTNVPTTRQVIPGASVAIVLKADQSTGREVQGTVQDLLTRGDHPRGIKVRLQDGRIGRVQRLMNGGTSVVSTVAPAQQTQTSKFKQNQRDCRLDDGYAEGPPPRSLADFLPQFDNHDAQTSLPEGINLSTAAFKCPICGEFEGDEAAVSHHIGEIHP